VSALGASPVGLNYYSLVLPSVLLTARADVTSDFLAGVIYDNAKRLKRHLAIPLTTTFYYTTTFTILHRCAAVETRLALAERLTTPSNYMTKPTSGVPQDRNPFGGHDVSSNLPRESVDPQGRHGKVYIGQRDKKRREKAENSLTSSDCSNTKTTRVNDSIHWSTRLYSRRLN
jgi:hypothetical protein